MPEGLNFWMTWMPGIAEARVEEGGHEGAENAAERVLAAAQQFVPRLSGMLSDTGKVDVQGSEATVSYDTKYAAILHEHPEWNFRGTGKAHWLDDALAHEGGAVAGDFANGIRTKL